MVDIIFSNVDMLELVQCEHGDELNLWICPDQSFVNAYRQGTYMNHGSSGNALV